MYRIATGMMSSTSLSKTLDKIEIIGDNLGGTKEGKRESSSIVAESIETHVTKSLFSMEIVVVVILVVVPMKRLIDSFNIIATAVLILSFHQLHTIFNERFTL